MGMRHMCYLVPPFVWLWLFLLHFRYVRAPCLNHVDRYAARAGLVARYVVVRERKAALAKELHDRQAQAGALRRGARQKSDEQIAAEGGAHLLDAGETRLAIEGVIGRTENVQHEMEVDATTLALERRHHEQEQADIDDGAQHLDVGLDGTADEEADSDDSEQVAEKARAEAKAKARAKLKTAQQIKNEILRKKNIAEATPLSAVLRQKGSADGGGVAGRFGGAGMGGIGGKGGKGGKGKGGGGAAAGASPRAQKQAHAEAGVMAALQAAHAHAGSVTKPGAGALSPQLAERKGRGKAGKGGKQTTAQALLANTAALTDDGTGGGTSPLQRAMQMGKALAHDGSGGGGGRFLSWTERSAYRPA